MKSLLIFFKIKNSFYDYLEFLHTDISLTFFDKIERSYKLLKVKRNEQKNIKKLGLNSLKNLQLVQNVSELNIKKIELLSKKERFSSMRSPQIIGFEAKKNEVLTAQVLNLKLHLLNDVYAYSKSTLISDGTLAFSQLLYNYKPKYDFKNSSLQSFSSFVMKKININFKKIETLEEEQIGIHLLNEHSTNYYHWLYEVMPKLIFINNYIMNNKDFRNRQYILIVDESLYKQMLEMINLIVEFNYQIHQVSTFNGIRCQQLLYCTDFWRSQDNTRFNPNVVEEFFVDKYAVQLILDSFKQHKSSTQPSKRIYLIRKGARQLINQQEIENILKVYEFEFVDIIQFSFLEQIKIFSEASIVLGASGAAFSNIVFMNKSSKAIIFTPNSLATNFYTFQQMADVAEISLLHILSENELKTVHDNLLISSNKLKNTLENILKLQTVHLHQ